jgi:hypothetical protein
MRSIYAGGNSNFLIKWDTDCMFRGEGDATRTIFKLPAGFNSVKKIKCMNDSKRVAVLSEGQLIILRQEESQLNIEVSIKLPCRSVIDFDIDTSCFYALIVSSEGDVTLYDIEKATQSENQIMNSQLRLSSRESVKHHRSL